MWFVIFSEHVINRGEIIDWRVLEMRRGIPLAIVRPVNPVYRRSRFHSKLNVRPLGARTTEALTNRLIAACLSASSIELL